MSYFLFRKPNSRNWFARIKAGGRSFDRSTHTTNRRTADRVAEGLERDALVSGSPVTLEKALTMLYEVQVDKGDSPHTLKRTELSGGHLVGYFGRHRDVRNNPIELSETTAYMRMRRQSVQDSTIYRELRTLKESLTNLKRHKLFDGTPSLIWPVGLPQTFAAKTRWLPALELSKLLDALPEYWRDPVLVLVFAGLRRSELFRLDADCCDFRAERLHAPGTKTEGADRHLPMHPMVVAVLRKRVKLKLPGPLFPTGKRTAEEEGRRLTMAIRRAAKKAGIAHCSPNDLRRTFCSWCYQSGIAESDCARWLGHKNSRMVREVYGHDSAENAAQKMRAVPSIDVAPTVAPDSAPTSGIDLN